MMTSTPVKTIFDSPLGSILLAATEQGLAGVWFTDQRHGPDASHWPESQQHPLLLKTRQALLSYFTGEAPDFDLPLDLSAGTEFQQSVWRALLRIPRGGHISYGKLSAQIGKPKAVRAVGAAVGRNPLSIIVPCHRVLGADGSLTGYAGGLARKVALLRLEGASVKEDPLFASLPA